eukprot:CAMPEP_0180494394 /NCGR_PEP_ID=MMETSP1036_2-20121128/41216_1 /TAXON_ID=632150 /ORGANISM="Azadinium spinosum, Strain 3D9" /LENGTH=87 /DNA_ID=CAMNT_0022502833 /DNA_START=149 /DNA_END=413 /DNA_ORIENTATION=-
MMIDVQFVIVAFRGEGLSGDGAESSTSENPDMASTVHAKFVGKLGLSKHSSSSMVQFPDASSHPTQPGGGVGTGGGAGVGAGVSMPV